MKCFSNSYPLKCFHLISSLFFDMKWIINISKSKFLFHTLLDSTAFLMCLCSFFHISEILWVGGSTPLIISELSLDAEAVVAGYFYPKDSQGLQNLSQVELRINDI